MRHPIRKPRHVARSVSTAVVLQLAALPGLAVFGASAAHAQSAAPITVTPPTLVPKSAESITRTDIPQVDGIAPPPGAENIALTLDAIAVSGGYPELQDQTDTIIRSVVGKPVTLAQVYSAASAIEASYARAGYVLARIAVPPQELADHGTLRLLLVDGFFEDIDLARVPARIRPTVAASVACLRNQHRLQLRDIERALLVAGDAPGMSLRSTLARGSRAGGSRLILDGTFKPTNASISVGNNYDPSLGSVGVQAQISLNSVFGRGELIYGFLASGYDLSRLFDNAAKVRVLGGGAIFRVGDGRLAVNPEATISRTRPDSAPGTPATVGLLHRYSLRASYKLAKTRSTSSGVTLAAEWINVANRATDFGVDISLDRYIVARLGANASWLGSRGGYTGVSFQFSHGLGNLGARTPAKAVASGVPFSRQGAGNGFSTLTLEAGTERALGAGFGVSVHLKGQTAFGQPTFRTEQFSLEGPTALSAYVGGATAVDDGVVGRVEVTAPPGRDRTRALAVTPYAFAATGWGQMNRPTAAEPKNITAANFGFGFRRITGASGLTFSAEYAFGISDFAPINHINRVNFMIGFGF